MVKICWLVLFISLSGCAHKATLPDTGAPIPTVSDCAEPPMLDLPVLSTSTLTEASTPDRVVKAYAADVEKLKAAVKQRDQILNSYRKPK